MGPIPNYVKVKGQQNPWLQLITGASPEQWEHESRVLFGS